MPLRRFVPTVSSECPAPSRWTTVVRLAVALCTALVPWPLATLSAQAPQPALPAVGASVSGTVADPDSAVIPGATVTLTPATGKASIVKSQGDGTYTVSNLRPGTYAETVTMPGFASFVKLNLRLAAGQSLTVDVRMAIQSQSQQVNVNASANTLSVDPETNSSATVIKGKDLEALSDDPDELSRNSARSLGPPPGQMAAKFTSTGLPEGNSPPNPRFARFASTRIHFPRSTTRSATAA